MTLFWGFCLMLVGAWFGMLLTNIRWELNSVSTDVVEQSDRTYKVVKLNTSFSWEMLDRYRARKPSDLGNYNDREEL